MSENNITICQISFSGLNFRQILEKTNKYLETGNWKLETREDQRANPLIIFTPNPEIVVYAQNDTKFKEIVNSAQINIPDGQGIVWAGKMLGKSLPERITGTDLAQKLVELAARKGLTIGLIGGEEGIALQALDCLKKKYLEIKGWAEEGPRIVVRNFEDGNWKIDLEDRILDNRKRRNLKIAIPAIQDQEIKNSKTQDQECLTSGLKNSSEGTLENYIDNLVNKIILTETQIIFVGLGAPKQEYFINLLTTNYQLPVTPMVLMAVGGTFDYWSGRVPRAPQWVQDIGFEWLYRLIRQPWRLKRQSALFKFILLVVRQKFRS